MATPSSNPEDSPTVRDARARYFEENGFGEDGGYSKTWVKLEFGPVPIWIPNTAERVRAVRVHDLHHVATGYATTPTGEAEIGAFEVAAGCGGYVAAWILNLWALAYGVLLAPRAVYRAFVRGLRSGSLYHPPGVDDALLDGSVAQMRDRLGIPAEPTATQPGDRLAFAGWAAVAWLWTGLSGVLVVLPIWMVVRILGA